MSDELEELRHRLGVSTALWAGVDGVVLHSDGWSAFSGTPSVDYNVVLCTGDRDALDLAVEQVRAAGTPTVIMVAGRALGEVQRLVARSWTCIGATPLMVRSLDAPLPALGGRAARRLETDREIAAARALVVDVFDIDDALAVTALPAPTAAHELWGAFDDGGELRSCLALVSVQETVVVWSMATAASAQGQGFGHAALSASLVAARDAGARRGLLYASPAGEPFYRRLGFAEVERWQMWSRPRWVLGRH